MSLLPEINQASAEINKFVAQANIHQTIAPVNPAEFTSPADTMLLASRDPVIREVSVGMTGVEAVQNTVSGTPPLSLPNSLGKPLKAWSVDVLPYQEGSGDPAPDNVRTIHGTDKLTITTAGKNLFGGETLADAIATKVPSAVKDTTNKTIKYNAQAINNVIIAEGFFKPNTRYTVIVNGSNASQLQAPNLKFTYTNGNTLTFGQFVNGVIAVTSEAGKTVRSIDGVWSTGTTTLNYELCGIFEGVLTADQFEPYVGASTTLTLPQTVYTGTIGSEGGESRWGEVDLGTLTWMYINIEGHRRFVASLYAKPNTINLLCSCYKAVAYSDVFNNTAIGIAIHTDVTQVAIYDPDYTDATSFKAAMSGVQLVYELATPTTFTLPSPTIPTPTGTATTWATAEDGIVGNMEVTYIKSE